MDLLTGGPFTSQREIDEYLANPAIVDKEKVNRLYTEVRYARDTCLSMPKTSDIFRLMKDHKRLSAEVYAKNLKIFMGNVVCNAQVTLDDLNSALEAITLEELD